MNARKLAAGLRLVADALEEEAYVTGARDLSTYTTHDLPPDVRTASTFHDVVKRIAGAEKRGRVWVVSRETWHAARRKRASTVANDVDATVAKMATNYRATRGA